MATPLEHELHYQQPFATVVAALGTDAQQGLSDGEARARLREHGRNELAAEQPVPAWRRFLAQFQDVLVILLLVATAISAGLWLYERDAALPYEAIAIFAVVLLNAVMGYVQESRAEAAVAALRAMSAARRARWFATASGGASRPPSVVPGDIILVEEGDTIPADARVVESTALQTAEAALTGESLPVSKDTDADRRRGRRSATATTWCSAARRRPTAAARAVVVATGMQTEMGRIAGLLQRDARRDDAAAAGARSHRQAARRRRRRHRGRDDRDDHRRRGRARLRRRSSTC